MRIAAIRGSGGGFFFFFFTYVTDETCIILFDMFLDCLRTVGRILAFRLARAIWIAMKPRRSPSQASLALSGVPGKLCAEIRERSRSPVEAAAS